MKRISMPRWIGCSSIALGESEAHSKPHLGITVGFLHELRHPLEGGRLWPQAQAHREIRCVALHLQVTGLSRYVPQGCGANRESAW